MSFDSIKEYFASQDEYIKARLEMSGGQSDFLTVDLDHLKSSLDELASMFAENLLSLRGYGFLDLGCGDARTLALASLYGMNCLGIEKNLELVDISRDNIRGLQKFGVNARIIHGDLTDTTLYNIRDFKIVYNFLTRSGDVARIINSSGLKGTVLLLDHFSSVPMELDLEYVGRIGSTNTISLTDVYVKI